MTSYKTNQKTTKIFLLFVILIIPFVPFAQVKYDDFYKEFNKYTPQQLFYRLFQYQNQNPHFANTYVQLGHYAEKIIEEIDPLRNFELHNYWVGNAVLYYSLFPAYLEGNEVRKNREFYSNIPIETVGKRLETEDVLFYVQQRTLRCNNRKDSVEMIFKALEKSKDHYNNCIRIFTNINKTYDNLNELLLQTDASLLKDLKSLEMEFKQSTEAFSNYRTYLENYPIKGYSQIYTLRPIETYRLDGLTNSDFMRDTFELWDYGSWIASFQKTYNSDIVSLRQEISSIQKLFTDNRRKILLSESLSPDDKFASYDEFFLFRLGKYDNSSLVRELFRYLKSRQDFLELSKSPLNSPLDSSGILINRKLRYYHRIILQQKSTEKELENFRQAITSDRITRFKDFFEQSYGGVNGLYQFASQEDLSLPQVTDNALQNLRVYLDNERATRYFTDDAQGTRGTIVPLYPIESDSERIGTLTYVTLGVSNLLGQPNYVSGYIHRLGRSPLAFAAKIDSEKKVEWIREIGAKGKDIHPQGDASSFIRSFNGGCIALVNERTANPKNTLVKLDNTGKDVFSKRIEIEASPVFFHYDEINQLSLITFQKNMGDSINTNTIFYMSSIDSIGNTQWVVPIELTGEPIDFIRTDSSYIYFFNFNTYYIQGARVNAGPNNDHQGLVMIEISHSGDFIRHTPIVSNESFFVERVFSLSNEEINIIGYSSDTFRRRAKFRYIIISPQGNILFKNYGD